MSADLHERVHALSDADLRQELMQAGEAVGPIIASTRPLFERKLLRCLQGDQQHTTERTETSNQPSFKAVEPSKSTDLQLSTTNGENVLYFGVAVPAACIGASSPNSRVFENKKAALTFMKDVPGSRFKLFTDRNAAKVFAGTEADSIVSKQEENTSDVNPEASAFKGPKVQDLTKLRKAIENGQLTVVRDTIWMNPRYLVSSGDTPVILQEGFRYNALHVCASKNQAGVAKLLLDTLSNQGFYQLLYPQDVPEVTEQRLKHLLDLYLNMPDKGNGETPLHFACKFGHVDTATVLLSQPSVDRNMLNKFGETPKQVICTRSKTHAGLVKHKIEELFECCCYVLLLRSEDNTTPAVVGEPWSPDPRVSKCQLPSAVHNSPVKSPLSLKAFAGPMSPQKAQEFKQQWTVPSSRYSESRKLMSIRMGDSDKGMERIGRKAAVEHGVTWLEHWNFLNEFADLTTTEGLEKLETYLKQKQHEAYLELKMGTHQRESVNNQRVGSSGIEVQLNDSLGDLSEQFGKLQLCSPEALSSTPRKAPGQGGSFVNPNFNVSLESSPIDVPTPPHNFGNSTMPKAPSAGVPAVAQRQLNLSNGDGFESDESCDSFYTAAHSPPPAAEMFTPPSSPVFTPVYIVGEEPSKADLDVLRALEDCELSSVNYPYICSWKKHIQSHSEQERNRWPTRGFVLEEGSSSATTEADISRICMTFTNHEPERPNLARKFIFFNPDD